jgi:hypothetical protein
MYSVVAWENSSVVAWGNSSVVAWENSSVEARENSSVVARGNSSVVAWENSSVVAWGNSSVVAWENSSVEARENSSVEARENSSVEARENSSVVARGNSSVVARENSSVEARENSSVEARGNSSVEARENSSVVARGNSSVVARENSSVVAWENSSVEARENSSVVAKANAQVLDASPYNNITISGNARIVHNPTDIQTYIEHHDIESADGKCKMYKVVRKEDGKYFSDWDRGFEYQIGETAVANGLDTDPEEDCGRGIHLAHKAWALDYGRNWTNLAILELEVEVDGVIVPTYGSGKVRAAKAKVLREVPMEECGLFGKMIAKKRNQSVSAV